MAKKKLFIGITTWNSEQFIGSCLEAIKATTVVEHDVCVLDNGSIDATQDIVEGFGCTFIRQPCNQGDALNVLLARSESEYTLLIHADTILLSERWFGLVESKITECTVLVSPEDIGCGPMTREYGRNKPESSFMFFATKPAQRLRQWRIRRRRFRIPLIVKKDFPFYSDHITHGIPKHLEEAGLTWSKMQVHTSKHLDHAWYTPTAVTSDWQQKMAYLEYGLGNFYSVDGELTHYHNWYDRVRTHSGMKDSVSTGKNNQGFPTEYVNAYSLKFLNDFKMKRVSIPLLDK